MDDDWGYPHLWKAPDWTLQASTGAMARSWRVLGAPATCFVWSMTFNLPSFKMKWCWMDINGMIFKKIDHDGTYQLFAIASRRIFGCPATQNPPLRCVADSEVLSCKRLRKFCPCAFRESAWKPTQPRSNQLPSECHGCVMRCVIQSDWPCAIHWFVRRDSHPWSPGPGEVLANRLQVRDLDHAKRGEQCRCGMILYGLSPSARLQLMGSYMYISILRIVYYVAYVCICGLTPDCLKHLKASKSA